MFLDFCSVGIPGHDEYDKVSFIIRIIKGGSQLILIFEGERDAVLSCQQKSLLVLCEVFIQRIMHFGETVHI